MQAFGLFRGKMSSWCSFRCPCLDELETKLYVNILYLVCCKMCVFYVFQTVRLTDDCIWPGGFFGVVIWFMTKWWCWLLISKTFAGFDVADLRSRWIQSIFPKCRLLASSRAECLLLGLFRGRMSSWCSFRCTCLDELESKSDVNILYLFCCKMCVFDVIQTVRLMDDWFWSGGFFGVVIGLAFNICIC